MWWILLLCVGKNNIIGKKVPVKDKWETPAIITLMPIVGVNNCQPILYTSKRMVHCYTTDETMNQFAIGYIINPSLKFNNVFITQAEKLLKCFILC